MVKMMLSAAKACTPTARSENAGVQALAALSLNPRFFARHMFHGVAPSGGGITSNIALSLTTGGGTQPRVH